MVFSSSVFIFLFLPIVIIGYYSLSHVKNSIFQKLFLIAASLFFYGYYKVEYLILIVSSIAVNYLVALVIQKGVNNSKKYGKVMLIIGILINVAIIGYFKYYDFFIENVNNIASTDFALKKIILPLGISFFTFQQLSFLISVYKKEEYVREFKDYCIFVLFFPQLVAGPIVLYSEMIPQFQDEKRRFFNTENFAYGTYMFVIGLFKKLVIADTIALLADNGFGLENPGLAASWVTALSYTFQIYFDFSGYSDMAIGLGKMFNIDIPYNFLSPYKSHSISEFWRRWHITLGRALSTYIYKPLGGNCKGAIRTCINLMITFFISGLWHGAAWTFVVWGLLNGLFCVIERILGKYLDKIPSVIRIATTFLIVNALWVLFRAEDFAQAMQIYRGMLDFTNINLIQVQNIANDGLINFPGIVDYAYVFGFIAVLAFLVFACKNSVERLKNAKPDVKTAVFTAVLFCVSMLCIERESVFIYFNF